MQIYMWMLSLNSLLTMRNLSIVCLSIKVSVLWINSLALKIFFLPHGRDALLACAKDESANINIRAACTSLITQVCRFSSDMTISVLTFSVGQP